MTPDESGMPRPAGAPDPAGAPSSGGTPDSEGPHSPEGPPVQAAAPSIQPPPPRPDGILRNITWLGIGSATVSPLWFLFISYLCIRNLTPEAYGTLNWALWLMIIAASVTDLGLNDFVTREVARRRDQAWRFFSNFLVFRAGLGTIVIGAVVGIAALLGAHNDKVSALALAGVYGLSIFLIGFCRVFFRAFQVLRYESASIMLEKLLVLICGTVMLFATGTATGTLFGMTAGMLVALALTLGFVANRIAPFEVATVNRDFLRRHLRVAAPLGVFAISVVAFMRMGPVILEFFEGAAEVGRFGAAFRIIEAMLMLPSLATAALLPRMSSAWASGGVTEFGRLVRQALLGMVLASGFLGLLLGVGGQALMNWIVKDPVAYAGAGLTLQILGLAYPVMCLNSVLSISLIAADGQGFLGRFMALVTGASAILMTLAIWQFGTAGLLAVFISVLAATTGGLWLRFRLITRPAAP